MEPNEGPLRQLLNAALSRHGLEVVRSTVHGDCCDGQLWSAFVEFARESVSGLHDGLTVPDGLDTLTLELVPARSEAHNIPSRPPRIRLSRRLYLVDGEEEWRRDEEVALLVDVNAASAAQIDWAQALVQGTGGPASEGGSVETWAHDIGNTTAGRMLFDSRGLESVVLD